MFQVLHVQIVLVNQEMTLESIFRGFVIPSRPNSQIFTSKFRKNEKSSISLIGEIRSKIDHKMTGSDSRVYFSRFRDT